MSYTDFTDKPAGGESDMENNSGLAADKKKTRIGRKKTSIILKPKLTQEQQGQISRFVKKNVKRKVYNNSATSSNGPVSSSNLFSEVSVVSSRSKRLVPRPDEKDPKKKRKGQMSRRNNQMKGKVSLAHTPSRPTQTTLGEAGKDVKEEYNERIAPTTDKNDPHSRLMGTDSLTNIYKRDTPGQEVDEQDKDTDNTKAVQVNGRTYVMSKIKKGWGLSDLQKKKKGTNMNRLPPNEDLSKLFGIDLVKESITKLLIRRVQRHLFGEGMIAPNPGGVKAPGPVNSYGSDKPGTLRPVKGNKVPSTNVSFMNKSTKQSNPLRPQKKPFIQQEAALGQVGNVEKIYAKGIKKFRSWKKKASFQWSGTSVPNVGAMSKNKFVGMNTSRAGGSL